MTEFDAEVVVQRRRFASEQTGWAVVEAEAADGEELVLVGPLIHLEARERARVLGTRVIDRRYGEQIQVTRAEPLPPTDGEAVLAYLRRVRHVGAKRAERLLEHFGAARAFEAIDADPAGAFGAVGLRGARAAQAAESWEALRATRRLHMLLAPYGLAYLAGRIHEEWGPGAHRLILATPYRLTSVFGVGFTIADRIARGVGIAADDPERTTAAVLHALAEAERGGSTCLTVAELQRAAAQLLQSAGPSEQELERLVARGVLCEDGGCLYRPPTAALEAELAARVLELVATPPSERLAGERGELAGERGGLAGERGGLADGAQLTGEQRRAVAAALRHRLSLITGGPGTGKTATIRAIALAAAARGARLALLAPTGRAAVRMTEASGVSARTVHSALGWIPGQGPEHDEDDPLECDLLVLDESSMANLELMVALLRAVDDHTHVVLVGDADQLAPVGAGKPFAELIESGRAPAVRLTHIFRQAAGSMIVQAAHAVRRGAPPSFAPAEGMRRDLFLLERPDPLAARREIVSLVAERLPAHYGVDPVAGIQVFAPVYKGELGIDALNQRLREALNPDGRPVGSGRLRVGDKLMMTGRNLHELGLMNGTVLRLVDEIEDREDEPALLLAAEGEGMFRLPPEESERLRLAYACSVHRGQGIELPVAVIVAHPAAGAFFLRREMLYTALTRARQATVVVGTREVLARAAATADTGRRRSRLVERLARGAG
jgi:exodeoxyribonuclease V alpha subunit